MVSLHTRAGVIGLFAVLQISVTVVVGVVVGRAGRSVTSLNQATGLKPAAQLGEVAA